MMNIFRIIGVLCAAFLTMGSGGVSKATSDQTPNTLEPEYIDAEPVADVLEAEPSIDVEDATSEDQAAGSPPIPATPTEMADEGAAIEVSLSDDYIQGRYYTGGGILGFDEATGHVGVYFSDNRDVIINAGLMTDRIQLFKSVEGLTLSAGARGYVALLSSPNDDVVGLAPGIEGRYGLPYNFPLAVVGNIFYSPDVLTLGDAEDIIDIDARLEAEFIPDIVGFIGYREFRFDSDQGDDKEAASEIQVGARFRL
ncbi:MAG: YfaZ family outer membrane protein [Geminicoccaceae bacterium]